MRRLVIGSIAIVLLAGVQCEPQETKVGPLTRLGQNRVVVKTLDADAKALGLSKKSLESQILVGLRRDIPRLAIRESSSPYLYLQVTVVRATYEGGGEGGFAAFVSLEMKRPVTILGAWTVATVWSDGVLLFGSREYIRQQVKDSIDEKLTEFAADYYRQNPP